MIGVHYETARIVRILSIFEPVELINDDLIYDPNNDPLVPDPDVN